MSVFSKLKNVLFTEEDETEEIPVINSYQEKKEIKEEEPRFKKINFEDVNPRKEEVKEDIKEDIRPIQIEDKSPFQSFDEEEFERIAAINKSKLIERDRRAREEKERSMNRYNSVGRKEIVEVKEEHKFKPTPVISPVYGILDKNYTKEDILPTASSEGTLPKIIDVDRVREKAFGTLEEIENNLNDDLNNIKITTFEENNIDDENIVLTNKSRLDKLDEENIELPKIEANDEEENIVEDITKEDVKEELSNVDTNDEIEKDLFNLIDSMYQDEEGDK